MWKANFGKTLIISSGSAEVASTSESQSIVSSTGAPETAPYRSQAALQNLVLTTAIATVAAEPVSTATDITAPPNKTSNAPLSALLQSQGRPFIRRADQGVPPTSSHNELGESIRTRALLDLLANRPEDDPPLDAHALEAWTTRLDRSQDVEDDRLSQARAVDRFFGQDFGDKLYPVI